MIIKCNKDLFNFGKCFTKGKTYEVSKYIANKSNLIDVQVINDLNEAHTIGLWFKHFTIIN